MNATTAPTEAFPLQWPTGRPRTDPARRVRAKFHAQKREPGFNGGTWIKREGISLASARDELIGELKLLGAKSVVLSTNLELRQS